jgi:hypothetical protein
VSANRTKEKHRKAKPKAGKGNEIERREKFEKAKRGRNAVRRIAWRARFFSRKTILLSVKSFFKLERLAVSAFDLPLLEINPHFMMIY